MRGLVKIEMPSPVGILPVVPALPDFVARYPDIVLDVRCSERVVDLVQEGVDCAIRGGHIADQDLVCRAIGLMRFTLCAAPSYLDAAPPLQSPADIACHRHLGFRFPATDRRYVPVLTRGDEQFALDPVPAMYFNSGSASAAVVVAGLGVTFLPKAEAEPHVQAGRLVEVLPDWQMGSMPMSFVYPPTRALSARVRAVADWVTGLMAANPVWAPPP
ncbi:MAG: HTH-type transcriptional regulator DmlR [Stenotrophomonas maltophilia]|uniref:HTH-type transcriptional regulator DmlR n=1 Tax=Stenotrophomonas maltophilia TaxID=40324 RepID=A0A7V8FG64_STEMA|nr:MAG: HTH-type transcriptional regulator DmlR [Stenotrophomonas maltophilia]